MRWGMTNPLRVLSFGGGLQTTACAILMVQGKIQADIVVFADTGGEKPDTYWYMEHYTEPLFATLGIPFHKIKKKDEGGLSLYDWMWKYSDIPWVGSRQCSAMFKRRPVTQFVGKEAIQMIGFSADEAKRADKPIHKDKVFPLIELGLSSTDCRRIIENYGWSIPLKSSCFFCPFQRFTEWNWLRGEYPELWEKALALEARFHERKPHLRNSVGLFGGGPLGHLIERKQPLLFRTQENSCWDGQCGH